MQYNVIYAGGEPPKAKGKNGRSARKKKGKTRI